MREWADFYHLVLPYAPGASDPAVDSALRQAAIQFLTRSHWLKRTLDPMRTRVGIADYELQLEQGEAMVRLVSAELDGELVDLLTPQQAKDRARDACAHDRPAAFVRSGATVSLLPAPALAGQRLVMEVEVRPSQDADGVDDVVFERWAQAIAFGAIALLCAQPGKPYTDERREATSALAFQAAINDAITDTQTGGARIRLRVKPY